MVHNKEHFPIYWPDRHFALPNTESIQEAIEMDSAIQAADDRMAYFAADEDELRAYEVRFKAECDWASEQAYSIEKGHAEEKLEIARKMKAIGRPLPEIADITGLTPEAIQEL